MASWGKWLVLILLLAGCTGSAPPPPLKESSAETSLAPAVGITCLLLGLKEEPVANGTCTARTTAGSETHEADGTGSVRWTFPRGSHVVLIGNASDRIEAKVELIADENKTVALHLAPRPIVAPASDAAGSRPPPVRRAWSVPTKVVAGETEPWVEVAPDGTLFVVPTSRLFASRDGGVSWRSEDPPDAAPTLASDASVSVAPDGTVWYSRLWGYLGGTLVCVRGPAEPMWTCNNLAAPGVTDRMWIAGISRQVAYLQTNQGVSEQVWMKTTDGGVTFKPWGANNDEISGAGNMVFDPTTRKVWQVALRGEETVLLLITEESAVPNACSVKIATKFDFPAVAASEGALWVAAQTATGVTVARSLDGCGSWTHWDLPTLARRTSFATVAARGDRVAVSYYGSTDPADASTNAGDWRLYVTETDGGRDRDVTWTERPVTDVLHRGLLCRGITCDPRGETGARFAGDFMGVAIDLEGNAIVAYNDDLRSPGTDLVMVAREGHAR